MEPATRKNYPIDNKTQKPQWDFQAFYNNVVRDSSTFKQTVNVTLLLYGPEAITTISSSEASKYVHGKKRIPLSIIREIMELPRRDLLYRINSLQLIDIRSCVQRLNHLSHVYTSVLSKNTIINWKKFQAKAMYDEIIADAFLQAVKPENNYFENENEGEVVTMLIEEVKKEAEKYKRDKQKVFVVHGHDSEAKYELSSVLKDWGLKPVILHEQADVGLTIIEKIERYSDVGFAIILYTGCDIGRSKTAPVESERKRARQNVVFEHGYLLEKLGRERVCALVKGDIELPSDLSGLVYTDMDDAGGWKIQLGKNMRAVGIDADLNQM